MAVSNELQLGKAGEYLVCADLIIKGFVAFPSEQGLSYDVVLDTGQTLLKIQVKTTLKARNVPQRGNEIGCYMFNVKRKGKNNTKRYADADVDIFALVALDSRTIGYVRNADLKTSMNFRVEALRGTYYDEKGVADFQRVQSMKRAGHSVKEIVAALNLNYSTVYRMLNENFTPFQSAARYLSDYERTADWFFTL